MQVDAVVLDIDGVLVDVSNSYRRAIVTSVEMVYGETIPRESVQSFKDAGGFNDDWVLTDAVSLFVLGQREGLSIDVAEFTTAIEDLGGGLEGAKLVLGERLNEPAFERVLDRWDPDRLRGVFQQLYLGPDRYRALEDADPNRYREETDDFDLPGDGFMADEPVLVEPATIDSLAEAVEIGVVTGRPRAEARLALDRVGLSVPDERLIAMEDGPGKPDPAGIITVAERTNARVIAFAGDTLDDIHTATNADATDPERTYYGIGVLTGGLTGEDGRVAFKDAGAEAVVASINDFPAIIGPAEDRD